VNIWASIKRFLAKPIWGEFTLPGLAFFFLVIYPLVAIIGVIMVLFEQDDDDDDLPGED